MHPELPSAVTHAVLLRANARRKAGGRAGILAGADRAARGFRRSPNSLGQRLGRCSRSTHRMGHAGSPFLLPGLADPVRLMMIAQRIVLRLSEPIRYEGRDCLISASIGLAVSSAYEAPTAEEMLNDADLALYAAKHAGRGCARMHAAPIAPKMM